ncbi:MAG: hypothetical protein MI725_08775 [Pirellulales bacterium]|nr:hypothetical protein [Pirellulales bacterium]
MQDSYLEVTFRHGRVLAAYYYLPRSSDARVVKTESAESGLKIDFDSEGIPLGIEITSPNSLTLVAFNAVLERFGYSPVEPQELAPLAA